MPPTSTSAAPSSAAPSSASSAPSLAKADLGKRFVAVLIDGIIAGVIAWVFRMIGGWHLYGLGILLGGTYILIRDGLEFDFADRRSVGKKLMKLRPVRIDGGVMDIEASVRRNWPLALGSLIQGISFLLGGFGGLLFLGGLGALAGLLGLVEAVLVLTDDTGRRLGDKFAETHVKGVTE